MLVDKEEAYKPKISCTLNCANGGYCAIDPLMTHSHNFLDGKMRQLCICPPGYSGLTCQQKIKSMDKCIRYNNSRVCLNGGVCRKVLNEHNLLDRYDENDDSEWMCDCMEAMGESIFAGKMCDRPHTEYCSDDGFAFCTNGGSCVNNLVIQTLSIQYEGSNACKCPQEFTGPHCEFLKALESTTEDTVSLEESTKGNTNHHGSGLMIALFLVIGAITASMFLTRKRLRHGFGGNENEVMNNNQFLRSGIESNNEQFEDNEGSRTHPLVNVDLT